MASGDPTFTPGSAVTVSQEAQLMLNNFWTNTLEEIKNLQPVSKSEDETLILKL